MPRHRTSSPCCVACRLRCELCVCGDAPLLKLATRLVLVMHFKEWATATNTGHLARLAIRNVEVQIHGRPHRPVSSAGIDLLSPSTLVLFPGRGAQPLTEAYLAPLTRPLTLVVPDGNWNQAKNMMRRIPMLGQAHRVRLDTPGLGLHCLRRNLVADRMSTFEAISQTLGILEGPEVASRLLGFLRQVLNQRNLHQPRRTF
jgi:DTW domain-containing protein YfiP